MRMVSGSYCLKFYKISIPLKLSFYHNCFNPLYFIYTSTNELKIYFPHYSMLIKIQKERKNQENQQKTFNLKEK